MILDEQVYLEHYGVPGMKWGVRKDRKTVSAEKQAKRDEKAKKFVQQANIMQVRMNAIDVKLNAKSGYFLGKGGLVKQKRELEKAKTQALKDAEAKRQGKLSSGQKKVVIGAVVAAGIIVAIGANSMKESGEFNRLSMKGKAWLEGKSGPTWKTNPKLADPNLDVDGIMDNVVKHVNPGFGQPGTTQNCRRATFAYEMRRRGVDVQATKTTNASGQNAIGVRNAVGMGRRKIEKPFQVTDSAAGTRVVDVALKQYGNTGANKIEVPAVRDAVAKSEALLKGLATQPNGSRGEVGVMWEFGGGHSMAYEIVKGKPVIFDNQTGKAFATADAVAKEFGGSVKDAGFTRLDNVLLNENFMMRWVKNVD